MKTQQPNTDLQQRAAAKEFVSHWQNRGDEKQDIGEYTPTKTIFQNMQDYAKLSAEKIHEILNLMNETPAEDS